MAVFPFAWLGRKPRDRFNASIRQIVAMASLVLAVVRIISFSSLELGLRVGRKTPTLMIGAQRISYRFGAYDRAAFGTMGLRRIEDNVRTRRTRVPTRTSE